MTGLDGAVSGIARSEWKRGWPAVAASMTGTAAGLQLFAYLGSLFVKPLASEFGWSRGQIASTSAAILVCALFMPVSGMIADRRGVRALAAVGAAAFVVSYLALASMSGALWQFLAVLAVIGVIGGPCTNYFLFARPIVAAFDRSRGLALSVSLCGVPLFGLVLFPVLQHIIVTFGWRAAYLTMAPVSLLLGATAFVLLGRASRAAQPRGARPPAETSAVEAVAGLSFREVLSDPRLWLLMLAAAGMCLPTGFYLSSLQPMLSDKGVDARTAALLGSWYAVAAIIGRIAVGSLLDRLPPILVSTLIMAAPAVALSTFFVAGGAQILLFGIGVGLFAVANGAEADVVCFMASRYFGLRANGRVNGLLGGISAVGIAVGGMASGFMYDRLGSYGAVLVAGAVTSVIAALAMLVTGWVGQASPAAA